MVEFRPITEENFETKVAEVIKEKAMTLEPVFIVVVQEAYNDIVTDYNKKVKKFPSDIIAKISKFKVRPYFDGKNMFDENIKDFKL